MRVASSTTIDLLYRRVDDARFCASFEAKVVHVESTGCLVWTGAVSGKGHGRVFLGRDHQGRTHAVIAHRFAFAMEHGVDALLEVELLSHRCDNPLCQRIGDGHVVRSTYAANRAEYLHRRHVAGGALASRGDALGQALALRERLRSGQVPPTSRVMQLGLFDELAGARPYRAVS